MCQFNFGCPKMSKVSNFHIENPIFFNCLFKSFEITHYVLRPHSQRILLRLITRGSSPDVFCLCFCVNFFHWSHIQGIDSELHACQYIGKAIHLL